MTPTAYVDESEPGDARDPGAYILAAVLVPDEAQDGLRDVLLALKPRSAKKLHWTESDSRHRDRVVEEISAEPVSSIGVVAILDLLARSERRRRIAFERLLLELTTVGVDRVVLESRGPADRLDRQHLDALRARRLLTGIRVEHIPGAAEPLLWAADAMCGIIAADRRCVERYRAVVGTKLVTHVERR
ncbi:hypothetical protein [Curtobacterium sp. ZW137]|uniref:hypothetical protein n=1 Tax=Curtobacterium sp. ZW137 TaxID=2485104 RepID=UPI000F4B7D1E|nr:hypothetical protein [Curtobacterium sp. ZW137]ROP63373.1 hypothetical protein EDF55_2127 [Curtobacterium sp. ZW137]